MAVVCGLWTSSESYSGLPFQVFINILSVQTTFLWMGFEGQIVSRCGIPVLPETGNVNYTRCRQPHNSLYEKNFLSDLFP